MKESYKEFLARNFGPESYADQGNLLGVATAGVQLGRVIEFRNPHQFVRRHPGTIGRQHQGNRDGEIFSEHSGIEDLLHGWKFQTREPG